MKFSCVKEKILDAVQKAEKVSGRNVSLPILSCLLIKTENNQIVISSTNLDLGINIKVPAKIEKSGVFAVPASLLVSGITNLSGDENLDFELIDSLVKISSGKNKISIKTNPHEDFPQIPKSNLEGFIINPSVLIEGFKSVWYSASFSSIKPELSSVFVFQSGDELFFVATDSFRLAEKRIKIKKIENFPGVLIPYKNVSEIVKIIDGVKGDIKITIDKAQISLESESFYLVSRIIEGNFPDYKQIIPKEPTTVVNVLKQDLIQSLKLAQVFSDNFNQVNISVDSNTKTLNVSSKNTDKGDNSSEIKIDIKGESVSLNFNQKYLNECFSSITSDSLVLKFNGNNKALILTGSKDIGFQYLVMPMNR